jgi:ABC-type Fe3+-hydroxamate transport system substrate-binding protein
MSRIVICGQSIFAMAIEASLATLPEVEVIRLHAYLPTLIERITTLQPDIVVIEHNQSRSDLALVLLSRGLPLVVLDSKQNQGLLITGHAFPVSDLIELVSSQKI